MAAQILFFTLTSNHAVVETGSATHVVPGTRVVFFTCENVGGTPKVKLSLDEHGHLSLIYFFFRCVWLWAPPFITIVVHGKRNVPWFYLIFIST